MMIDNCGTRGRTGKFIDIKVRRELDYHSDTVKTSNTDILFSVQPLKLSEHFNPTGSTFRVENRK